MKEFIVLYSSPDQSNDVTSHVKAETSDEAKKVVKEAYLKRYGLPYCGSMQVSEVKEEIKKGPGECIGKIETNLKKTY